LQFHKLASQRDSSADCGDIGFAPTAEGRLPTISSSPPRRGARSPDRRLRLRESAWLGTGLIIAGVISIIRMSGGGALALLMAGAAATVLLRYPRFPTVALLMLGGVVTGAMVGARVQTLGPELIRVGQEISARLGWRGPNHASGQRFDVPDIFMD
jgi:hypothetical protein